MKNIEHKIKSYNLFMGLYFFIVLFYVYNTSFVYIMPNSALITFILIFVSLFSLFLASYKYMNKTRGTLLFILSIFIFLVLFRNGNMRHGSNISVIYMLFVLVSIYFLSFTNKWHKIALKVFNIFILEHIIATFVCSIFPKFYYSNILPMFSNYSSELVHQFNHNQIAGITNHYSKNALYLVSGLLINTPIIINKDKRTFKDYIFLIINVIALLLSGKRSQIVTYVISIIVILIVKYRKNIMKFIEKIFIISLISIASITFLAHYIPNITNSFVKIYETLADDESMNSRNVLYNLAISEFKNNKLIGIGWDNYRYTYNKKIMKKEREYMTVHNIYLQVLCETGIIGSIFIFTIFIILIILPIKTINKTKDKKIIIITYMFIAYHVFFLLEGILGNSLYDLQTYTPYAIILSMYLYYYYEEKINSKKKVM